MFFINRCYFKWQTSQLNLKVGLQKPEKFGSEVKEGHYVLLPDKININWIQPTTVNFHFPAKPKKIIKKTRRSTIKDSGN